MFFKGDKFKFTYSQDGVYSHSKLALCYDVTQKNDIKSFKRIPSIAHLFSTPTYQNITTFKYVSKRFQLDNILNRFFSMMTWISYSVSMDCAIMSLELFTVQWVTHIIAWKFWWEILNIIFIMGSRSVDFYFITH